MRALLFCFGILWISKRKVKISDFIADYKPKSDPSEKAPINISNHSSWMDMFFYLMEDVSFLSKDEVSRMPFVSMFAIARQCLFLDRSSTEDRDRIRDMIAERADRIKTHGDLPPLLIFPEGTVSNNRSLLSFKKGAFMTNDLIKIFSIKYNTWGASFVPSIVNMSALFSMIATMSTLANNIEYTVFEDNLDPQWVYEKYNLDPEDEDSWKQVAQEAKTLISLAGGFHQTSTSSREVKEFDLKCEEYNKECLLKSK